MFATHKDASAARRLLDAGANLLGRLSSVAISLVLVPVYIHYIGIEAYGLIGLSVAIQAFFSLLDLGFSTAILRETAKLTVEGSARNTHLSVLLRTFEVSFWLLATLLAIVAIGILPIYASRWIDARSLPADQVRHGLLLMGVAIALRFPALPYIGLLSGLQRQLLVNLVSVAVLIVRAMGSIAIFEMGDRTIVAFYSWQLVATLGEVALFAFCGWRAVSVGFRTARPSWTVVVTVWPFARGVLAISATAALFAQADKILLTHALPLAKFGAYAVAATLSFGLYNLVYPFASAAIPRLTQLSHVRDTRGVSEICLLYSQFAMLFAMPVGLVITIFAPDIAALYLRDPAVAADVAPLVRVMMIGALFGALIPLPHSLQLAMGKTAMIILSNCVGVAILLPAIWFLSGRYGAYGAALAWSGANSIYAILLLGLIARGLPRDLATRWALRVVILPLAAGLCGAAVALYIVELTNSGRVISVILALATTYLAVFSVCRAAREDIASVLKPLYSR